MVTPPLTDRWDLLRRGAEAWHALQLGGNFSVNVGDASGTLFRWESPGFDSATTHMEGASLSKWPSAIMIAGLVHDGTLRWEDHAHKHLPWWTKNPSDPRSRVRLYHLLSFTSGYSRDGIASPLCNLAPESNRFMVCAESLYNHSETDTYEPGKHWAYLTSHLQFAGAMAVAASGLQIDELYERYLYKPFNMTSTAWYTLHRRT